VSFLALSPVGPQAGRINNLWWILFWVCMAVFTAVSLALFYSLMRRERRADDDRSLVRGVAGASILTTVILLVLLTVSVSTGNGIHSVPDPNALTIQVIGRQWWWEVHYRHPVPGPEVVTANEIHVPVGKPVQLDLVSNDVIHSFWAPNIHGKKDLIPGHPNTTWFQVDRPGEYRGVCAEFCGVQHAHMAFLIVAEPEEKFRQWLEWQGKPAIAPVTEDQKKGHDLFVSGPCVMCHSIRGTEAGAQAAPDLTHFGSRRSIAAGTLPNTKGHLAGWIVDAQQVKPGANMPTMNLAPSAIEPLLAYLESLR
jgi:cytochrome c oxidase subunit 2